MSRIFAFGTPTMTFNGFFLKVVVFGRVERGSGLLFKQGAILFRLILKFKLLNSSDEELRDI